MTDLIALKEANSKRWSNAKITRGPEFAEVAHRLVAAKQRYITVQNRTGVPWFFIAVIHEREASQNFNTQLGQGDPLHSKSVHVPVGRGPFDTWEDGAIDALVKCSPFSARNMDWSPGGLLTETEKYNGLAYANHGVPSPYVWSGTNQYIAGKILVDHGPIEPVADKQLGCAGLIMAMMDLDSSISLGNKPNSANAVPSPPPSMPKRDSPPLVPTAPPSITNPSNGSIGAFIASVLAAIFKRKG